MAQRHAQLVKTREEAWIGDAVLELWVRRWVLQEDGQMDGAKAGRLTCNRFLNCFGNPTEVEAKIGRIYESEGLTAAEEWIENELLPLFLKQEKKLRKP